MTHPGPLSNCCKASAKVTLGKILHSGEQARAYWCTQCGQQCDVLPTAPALPVNGDEELRKAIDDIVFRCFAQGQYWGSDHNGDLDPDYEPENPIDRSEAVRELLALHTQAQGTDLAAADSGAALSVSNPPECWCPCHNAFPKMICDDCKLHATAAPSSREGEQKTKDFLKSLIIAYNQSTTLLGMDGDKAMDICLSSILAWHTQQVEAAKEKAEGIGAYVAISMLLQNMGYLLAHKAEGSLPEMTAEVVGELYKQMQSTLKANDHFMRSTPPQKENQ